MRGQILVELGEYESAGEHFERALAALTDQAPPTSRGAALAGRAYVRAGLGDTIRATADFAEATRLAPENAWIHYLQGRVYHQKGEPDAASLCFRLALRVERPELSPRQRERVEAYLRARRVAE
jgi:tetratricopeptide (TPR) repeat protein